MIEGIIYSIRCKDNPKPLYIGSTYSTKRWENHKKRYRQGFIKGVYEFIRQNGGIDNFYYQIELEYECKDLQSLYDKEYEILEEYKNDGEYNILNINKPAKLKKNITYEMLLEKKGKKKWLRVY
jgi:hypothetical protein